MTAAHHARERLAKARTQVTGPSDVWLVARMCAWCCVLRMLKRLASLPWLVRLVKQAPRRPRDRRLEQKVVVLARWTCRFTKWSDTGPCLERALVTFRYLTALGADPVLVVGMAPGLQAPESVRGHAWVTVDGEPVDDTAESLAGFEQVVAYSSDGHQRSA